MFSSLSREDFSRARSRKALPVFCLLWAGTVFLAIFYIFNIRAQLHAIERSETEKLLTGYLAVNHSDTLSTNPRAAGQEELLNGLAFIRLVRGKDHIILVNERSGHSALGGLVDLSPDKTGIWLHIGSGQEKRILSIITRKYGSNILIQAAKDGQQWYDLYRKLLWQTLLAVLCSALFLWPFSLFYVRFSLSALTGTIKKIAELTKSSKVDLLPESGNGPELDSLYKQINRLLRQNRHLLSEMQDSLDYVAHDLRTPMTRLRSVAEYGLQAEDDTDRLREALSDCLEESERVLAMLKIMMSVVEAESGTLQLELQECEVGAMVIEVITLYEYVAEESGVEVTLESADPVRVRLDRTRITQVWANLLDNAIKYGREGGWVKISVTSDGPYCVVVFEDNGMGISESEQGRIWERLYRGDRSRSRKGLGLGLNYVRAVLQAHGGTVSVDSILHQGSRFEVRLPLSQIAFSRTQEKSQTRGEWSESRTSGI